MDRTTLTEHYTDGVLTKAERLIAQGRVHQDENDSLLYRVKGSKIYKVRVIELGVDEDGEPVSDDGMPFVTCDCPNGLHRGGRPSCYHSASVIITLQKKESETE